MRRLLLHLITALLTFSVGYSLAWVTEVYNLKIEIREHERRAESDNNYHELSVFRQQSRRGDGRVGLCPVGKPPRKEPTR